MCSAGISKQGKTVLLVRTSHCRGKSLATQIGAEARADPA